MFGGDLSKLYCPLAPLQNQPLIRGREMKRRGSDGAADAIVACDLLVFSELLTRRDDAPPSDPLGAHDLSKPLIELIQNPTLLASLAGTGVRMVSVCIPCFNEQDFLPSCLKSVCASAAAAKVPVEIVVADNGSTDHSVEVARSYGAIVVSVPDAKTVPAVRNATIESARGNWLAFLDADVIVPLHWIERGIELFASDVVTGAANYRVPESAHWAARKWYNAAGRRTGKVRYISSSNLWVSKSMFSHLNGFAENLESDEDCDFCARAAKAGARIVADPSLEICHLGAETSLLQFFRRHQWHGMGALRSFIRNLPALANLRAMTIALYFLLLPLALLVSLGFGKWSLAGLIAALIFAAACAMALARNPSLKALPEMVILCLVYGLARASSLLRLGPSKSPRS